MLYDISSGWRGGRISTKFDLSLKKYNGRISSNYFQLSVYDMYMELNEDSAKRVRYVRVLVEEREEDMA